MAVSLAVHRRQLHRSLPAVRCRSPRSAATPSTSPSGWLARVPTAYFGAVGDDADGATVEAALASAGVDTRESRCARSPPPSRLVELRPTATGCSWRSTSAPAGSTGPRPRLWPRPWTTRTWVHGVGLATPRRCSAEASPRLLRLLRHTEPAVIEASPPRLDLAFISAAGSDRQTALERAEAAVAAGAKAAVVTRGGEGSLACNGRVVERPAEPVAVVDTLGAGDALIAP